MLLALFTAVCPVISTSPAVIRTEGALALPSACPSATSDAAARTAEQVSARRGHHHRGNTGSVTQHQGHRHGHQVAPRHQISLHALSFLWEKKTRRGANGERRHVTLTPVGVCERSWQRK